MTWMRFGWFNRAVELKLEGAPVVDNDWTELRLGKRVNNVFAAWTVFATESLRFELLAMLLAIVVD